MNNEDVRQLPARPAAIADQLPGPGHFSGHQQENGRDWLETFEIWAQCKGITDDVKASALALHLRDAAATWLRIQHTDVRSSWRDLRAAFLDRYGPDRQAGWQKAGQIWTMTQQVGQPVLDFIDSVERVARDADIPAELQFAAVVNGLRPSIRAFVLRQSPENLDALRHAARLAERTELPSGTDDTAEAIRRIERQLAQLSCNTLQSATSDRRPYPESDDEYRRRHTSPSPATRRPPSSRSPSRERAPPRGEDRYYRRQDNNRHRDQTPHDRRRVTFEDQSNSRNRHFPPCDSCGRRNHPRSRCYYRDATCTACSRTGHLSSVCRSALF